MDHSDPTEEQESADQATGFLADDVAKRLKGAFEEYHLSPFGWIAVQKWIQLISDPARQDLQRLRQWILDKLNGREKGTMGSKWQLRSPEILPLLRSAGFWVASGVSIMNARTQEHEETGALASELTKTQHRQVLSSIAESEETLDGILSRVTVRLDPSLVVPSASSPLVDCFQEIVDMLESNHAAVVEELLQLRDGRGSGRGTGFQPYRNPGQEPGEGERGSEGEERSEQQKASSSVPKDGIGTKSHDVGDWNVFYLYLHNVSFEENCRRCPKTIELIENVGSALAAAKRSPSSTSKTVSREYHHAFFSALTPGSHIVKHNGPTNKKLRLHLPLVGTEGSVMRVGEEYICPKVRKRD